MYDHRNRLLRRNDEFFVHDGWQIVLTLDSKGNVKDQYLWGVKQDELIAENDNWTLCDHLGTVRDVIDSNGKIVSHLEYNAFGKLLSAGGDKPLFRYTGKLFDDVTQLQWNINRWYDAKVGRWCSEDPIGFRAKDVNLCRYVYNNPPIIRDFFGLWSINRSLGAKATAQVNVTVVGENEIQYNDTLRSLADKIHLNINEVLQWITADSEYRIVGQSKKKKISQIGYDEKWYVGQSVEVPNTIFSVFMADDLQSIFLNKFDVDTSFMKGKGVRVMKYFNFLLPLNVRQNTLTNKVSQYSSNKELWGLHLSAHGGPRVGTTPENALFGARTHDNNGVLIPDGGPLIHYRDLSLSYKLGFFYGFACFSQVWNAQSN